MIASRGGPAWRTKACEPLKSCASVSARSRAASTDCSSADASTTKPGGTGRPCPVMLARLAPFPPVRRTSLHASSENQRMELLLLLFIDDPYRSYWRSHCTNPFHRKDGQLEAVRRELV